MTRQIPRWGNEARGQKADAIWATMNAVCGRDLASGNWLDIGCGSGGIAASIAPKVRSIVGVDPEPWDSWELLTQNNANLQLVTGKFDGQPLPVPRSSIDVAICNQVYEHVEDPRALIRNIASILKPDGVCYFAGPNLLWPVEPHVFWPFVHWLPRRSAQRLMGYLGSSKAPELDAFSANIWKLRRWFWEAGFRERCIVRERLAVGLDAGSHRWAASVVRRVPDFLFSLTEPFHPSFVFVLQQKGSYRE